MKIRVRYKSVLCSLCMAVLGIASSCSVNRNAFPKISVATSQGEPLVMTLINHGSLLFEFRDKKYYIDPVEVPRKC